MKASKRSILRAQGRMVTITHGFRQRRKLRSWVPEIVGNESKPSHPGPNFQPWTVTGKRFRRFKMKLNRMVRSSVTIQPTKS